MRRGVLAVIALTVVGLAIGLYTLVSSLDAIVKAAIEEYGAEMTGTTVRVSSVEIALSSGRGTIRGLRIGNPAGFSSGSAFELREITLDIDPTSLGGEPVVIDEIVIRAPAVSYELGERGRSNLDVIAENLRRASAGGEAAGLGSEGAPRLRVKRFVFEAGRLNADTTAVGGRELAADLPSLQMHDLGGSRGATGAEIGNRVMAAYTRKVLAAVAGGRLDRLIDEKLGGDAGKAVKGLLHRLTE